MATAAQVLSLALPLVVGVALVALSVLVARSSGRHLHARLFAALYFLSGLKSIGEGLTARLAFTDAAGTTQEFHFADWASQSSLFPDAAAWFLLSQLCGIVMLPLLFLFCAAFPTPTGWMRRRPLLGLLAFVPSAFIAALLLVAPESSAFALAALAFNILSTGMTVAALLLLLRARRASKDPIERTQAGYVVLGFLPSFVATWAITALILAIVLGAIDVSLALGQVTFILHFVSPLFEIVSAGLVGFAILKYNILGVDPKFRVGVKSALAGFIFVLVFLVTQVIESQLLEGQLFRFAGQYGFLLSAVTGVVLFKPIGTVSTKVTNRLLPERKGAAGIDQRAAEVYHAQCSYVLRDGNVSEREMAFLRNLRTQLGLTEAQARSVEEQVERLLKVDAPQTGASATTAVGHVAQAQMEMGPTPAEPRASPEPGERAGPPT